MEALGIYVSVPFCRAKCTFCNFASDAFALDGVDAYVDRVCEEIRGIRRRAAALNAVGSRAIVPEGSHHLVPGTVDTIYFGGGTPSLLEAPQMERIFATIAAEFEIAAGAEVTLECAPGQLSESTLEAAMRLGVNRVSFGVQSFVDAETRAVGRLHTAADCRAEIARVQAAGISAISLDLIAGLPGQTAASWEVSVAGVVNAGVSHASVYMLEVDEESRLGKELIGSGVRYGASTVPAEEAMTKMYARACVVFEAAGLAQYEISNFARIGCESRHNLKYWQREPYMGFGLDAHSMLQRGDGSAVRFANADAMGKYLRDAGSSVTAVGVHEAAEERVFLGLRMNEGVASELLRGNHSVEEMMRGGLMRREGGRVMLTGRGRLVSNEVFGELLRVAV